MAYRNGQRRRFLAGLTGAATLLWARPQALLAESVPSADLVVFIPGITGSVLQVDGRDVWAPTAGALAHALTMLGHSLDRLALTDDPPDVDDLGDGVVATRLVPDVHLLPGFWKIDGYSGVRSAIGRRVDLQPGLNYIEFPYDWRRDIRVAARKLSTRIPVWLERWQKASGNSSARVVLVGHSMGGLVARCYLENYEGWRVARKLVTIGTPYRGSLNALNYLVNGYKIDVAGIPFADLSTLMRSFTSVYQLLPIYPCVDPGDGPLRRPAELAGVPNLDAKRAAAGLAFHHQLRSGICASARSSEYRAYPIHPVVGIDQATYQSARIKAGRLEMARAIGGVDESGDGTVPRPSAVPLGCAADDDERLSGAALYVPGVHGSLQNLPQVVTQVSYVLRAALSFDAYRDREPLSIEVDDLHRAGEAITIRCRGGPRRRLAHLVVEDAATGAVVHRERLVLAPDESARVALAPLAAACYRATLEVDWQGGNQNRDRAFVSDLFLVSR